MASDAVGVTTRGGHRVRLPVALLRAIACALLPVGLLWCAGRRRLSLQDLALHTTVVYDWAQRPAKPGPRAFPANRPRDDLGGHRFEAADDDTRGTTWLRARTDVVAPPSGALSGSPSS